MEDKVMNHLGYQGSMTISIEDGVLHGSILNINDLVTYEAETPSELLKAFKESVEEYLSFCKRKGVSPEKPMSGSFNVRIGQELHKKSVQYAARKAISLNEFIKAAITSYLECEGKEIHHHYHLGDQAESASWAARVPIDAPATQAPKFIMKVVH